MDLNQLEAKKRKLSAEIELLEKRRKALKDAIGEGIGDKEDLEIKLGELDNKQYIKIEQVAKLKSDYDKLLKWYEKQRTIYTGTLGKEVEKLLDDIRDLEGKLKTKQITYSDYELSLAKKEKQLIDKSNEIEHKINSLDVKENEAKVSQKKADEMLLKLKNWASELAEKEQFLGFKDKIATNKLEEAKEKIEDLEIEKKDFKGTAGEWVEKFEGKRKIVLGLISILEQRQRFLDEQFEFIAKEKIWLQDQRDSLNLAWAELKKLQASNKNI